MDPLISAALASLIGAMTTSILMASAYYWGPNRRETKRVREAKRIEDNGESENPDE